MLEFFYETNIKRKKLEKEITVGKDIIHKRKALL